MTTCSKCGRLNGSEYQPGTNPFLCCTRHGGEECRAFAAAYAKGIRDMLAVAKRTAAPRQVRDAWSNVIAVKFDWTETEREAAKLAGEVDRG